MTSPLPSRSQIVVELYGIPRQRAGTARIEVPLDGPEVALDTLLRQLASSHPELARSCFPAGQLALDCAANVEGRRFVRDPHTRLVAGQVLLLMSADVGG